MDNVITRNSVIFTEMMSKINKMEIEVENMKDANLSSAGKWLNGEAVMRKLGISKRTLQNYRDMEILPYSAVGSKFYYNINDIEDLLTNNYVGAGK
jgi:uncharacterized protein YqgQ